LLRKQQKALGGYFILPHPVLKTGNKTTNINVNTALYTHC